MARKNIFEILSQDYDLYREASKIHRLLTRSVVGYHEGIEYTVDKSLFLKWKYRGTSTSLIEFRTERGISKEDVLINDICFDVFLSYLEYTLNVVSLATKRIVIPYDRRELGDAIESVFENIKILLNAFNYDYKNLDKGNIKMIVVEKNPQATAVSEIIEDDEVSIDVIRYNHFLLKGDLYEKKKILTQLYKEYEKIKPQLLSSNELLSKDLGFMFNALGIRHDKTNNKITNQLVADMTDEQVEEWCDKVYDTFLLAELSVNYLEMKDDIKWLKTGDVDKEHG